MKMKHLLTKLKAWKVYVNTNNCGFCIDQVRFFQENLTYVNVIHCDDMKNDKKCSTIPGLPLWEHDNGKKIEGAILSMDQFSKLIE